MVGLIDYALQTSTSTSFLVPNLEIMKLATYYRTEENTFCRLVGLEENELTGYDKIYFFCEDTIRPQVPPQFLRADNVIFGGTAFTNGEYKPFDNEIIDYTIPRPAIYKEFLKQKYQEGIRTNVIEHVLDDTYYRNYAGDNTLPLPVIHSRKRVFLYDKEFFYPDWEQTIQRIADHSPSSIIRIHPIVCRTLSDYFKLREQPKVKRTCTIILDLNIPLNEVGYMLKKYKNLFLADVNTNSNVCISLGGSQPSVYHYLNDFIYKLNLLYSYWSAGILVKIKYEEPKLGFTDPLSNLSKFVEKWANGKTKANKTLDEKMPKPARKADKVPIREEKNYLLKFHPSAKDLFTQSFESLKKGGYWRV